MRISQLQKESLDGGLFLRRSRLEDSLGIVALTFMQLQAGHKNIQYFPIWQQGTIFVITIEKRPQQKPLPVIYPFIKCVQDKCVNKIYFCNRAVSNLKNMLKFDKNVPVKDTHAYLAKFPRFSLIEKITPKCFQTEAEGSLAIANTIKEEILRKNAQGQTCVLGLATGSSPLRVYRELIRFHKSDELSFKNVVTFNLDEYYPIKATDSNSYHHYMHHNLFRHIDIPPENINIPDGEIPRQDITKFCDSYEKKIKSYGGIDIQILGIGRTGHIGFNQPPSSVNSVTRLVYLNKLTRKDESNYFGGYEKVPKCALTMGIDTIKKARKIIIMAWSQVKADIVLRTIEGQQSNNVPSTFLHNHPDAVFYLDKAAGQSLTRFNTPWTIRGDIEDPTVPKSKYWVVKSVAWLSQKLNKPLLRLTYDDYEEQNLAQLIMDCANGCVEDLNLYVYKKIINRITGWPLGGRPQDSEQVQMASIPKKSIKPEKVLIFSPHPDDDVISMGGTLKTLHDQGHNVNVAYMTSGSNGVLDIQARKYIYFLKDFSQKYFFKLQNFHKGQNFISEYNKLIEETSKTFERDTEQQGRKTEINLAIKQFIRSSEAKIALNSLGLSEVQAYALELPFYGVSHKNRKEIGEEDYEVIRSLLRLVEPTAVYAAGDLSDPHGTHRKCLEILIHIFYQEKAKAQKDPSYKSLFPPQQKFFLYRGAWTEWQVSMARVIVPLTPKYVNFKTQAILKHQSQKDGAKYLGDDKRQFWERAKERNRGFAQLLNKLGFSNYQACQCFVNLSDLMKYDEI